MWIFLFYLCENKKLIMATKVKISAPDQVKLALDGRTQRWLAMEIKIPEDSLSQKMNGLKDFTQSEIDAINNRLGSNIKL